jgi:ubiquinone biosynthesis protein
VKKIPELIQRIDQYYPPKGAAPPAPPLPEIAVIDPRPRWGYALAGIIGAVIGALLLYVLV